MDTWTDTDTFSCWYVADCSDPDACWVFFRCMSLICCRTVNSSTSSPSWTTTLRIILLVLCHTGKQGYPWWGSINPHSHPRPLTLASIGWFIFWCQPCDTHVAPEACLWLEFYCERWIVYKRFDSFERLFQTKKMNRIEILVAVKYIYNWYIFSYICAVPNSWT